MRTKVFSSSLLLVALAIAPALDALAAADTDPNIQRRLDAIATAPDEPRNYFNLGIEYYNRDQYQLASKSFQKALKVGKKNKEAHASLDLDCYQILGDIHMRLEDHKAAAKWFAKGLKLNPRDHVCLFGRGQAFFLGKDYASARKALTLYINTVSSSGDKKARANAPIALTYLGAMAMEKKKPDEAADYFRRVITEYPKQSKTASQNLAIVLLTKGDKLAKKKKNVEAAALYDEAVAVDPQNPSALKLSARTHYTIAEELAATKLPADKAKADSHFALAERNFKRAGRLDENDFQSWYYAGLSQYHLEKYADMLDSYRQSVKINPNQPGARYNLALASYRQQLYEEALSEAQEAKKLAPKDRDVNALINNIYDGYKNECMNKGFEALSADRFKEAITWWEKALELDPHTPDANEYIEQARVRMAEMIEEHIRKGDAAYAEKDLLTASNEWNAAYRMDPGNQEIKDKLDKVSVGKRVQAILAGAERSYRRKDYADAAAKVQDALRISPRDKGALSLLSKIKRSRASGITSLIASAKKDMRSGRLVRARQRLSSAREADPKNKDVTALLLQLNDRIEKTIEKNELAAAAALGKGDRKSAQKSYEIILALDPNHDAAAKAIRKLTGKESKATVDAAQIKKLNKQGIFAYMQNDLKGAEKAWSQALKLDPNNTEIKRSLDRVHMKMGKTKQG